MQRRKPAKPSPSRSTSVRAFTLLEILIVVVILGILAAVIVPQASSARSEARDGTRGQHLRAVEKALEMYTNDLGEYPRTSGWSGDAPSYGGLDYEGENSYIPGLSPTYMAVLPRDPNPAYPRGSQGYVYYSNGANYKFLAHQTPESYGENLPFYDPRRPTHAWQVSTPGGLIW